MSKIMYFWLMNTSNLKPQKTLFETYSLPNIRTYRIPYIGSKNAIATKIIEAILNNTVNHKNRRFVDAFCGGGAIAYGILQTKMFSNILANDYNNEIIDLHKNLLSLDLMYIAKTPCILKPNKALQDKYAYLKLIDEIEYKYRMAFKIVYSFGNNCMTNLWGTEIGIKYEISKLLFSKPHLISKVISEYLGLDCDIPFNSNGNNISTIYNDYKKHILLYKKQLGRLQQLQQLQQLGRLQQLEQLQQLQQLQQLEQLQPISYNCCSYKDIDYGNNDIVYFDPPYRLDKKKEIKYHNTVFDNDEFECFAKSLKMPVFISEYQPKIAGFTPILKIPKLSTFYNINSTKATKQRYEYLHWNGVS